MAVAAWGILDCDPPPRQDAPRVIEDSRRAPQKTGCPKGYREEGLVCKWIRDDEKPAGDCIATDWKPIDSRQRGLTIEFTECVK